MQSTECKQAFSQKVKKTNKKQKTKQKTKQKQNKTKNNNNNNYNKVRMISSLRLLIIGHQMEVTIIKTEHQQFIIHYVHAG